MKKSILLISLAFALSACSSDTADKKTDGKGWTLGQNNSNNNAPNNGMQNNGQNNNGQNNGATSVSNNLTSNNNGITSNNNSTTNQNNQTTGSSNNNTTNGGLTTSAECNLNSECQNGLFCCPQGFQGGPGTCESSCRMNGGKCGGNHSECNEPTEGCCEQIDVCSDRCAQTPPGDSCVTNPDCSNGQLCCPSFSGGDSSCADDCGNARLGGVCNTAADCSGQTGMCCDIPIGTNKLCLQQCGI